MSTGRVVLAPGLFITPTGSGALRVVTGTSDGPAETLIRFLLRSPDAITTDTRDLVSRSGLADTDTLIGAIADAQRHGWLEGRARPLPMPEGPLGVELPTLLAPLAQNGRAMLVDDQGFTLATTGFTPEAADELAILAAEVARLRQRRSIEAASSAPIESWALTDSRGVPDISICPIQVGSQPFSLILGGFPRLHQQAFVTLAILLSRRYADDEPPVGPATGSGIAAAVTRSQ